MSSIASACTGPFTRDNGKHRCKRMCSHWSVCQTSSSLGCFLLKLIHCLTWMTSLTIKENSPDRFASVYASCHSTELNDLLSRWKIPASGRSRLLGIRYKQLALMQRISGRKIRISSRQILRMYPHPSLAVTSQPVSSAASLDFLIRKMGLQREKCASPPRRTIRAFEGVR